MNKYLVKYQFYCIYPTNSFLTIFNILTNIVYRAKYLNVNNIVHYITFKKKFECVEIFKNMIIIST
jgi:hypothetical protein